LEECAAWEKIVRRPKVAESETDAERTAAEIFATVASSNLTRGPETLRGLRRWDDATSITWCGGWLALA
jgi:hypothetical protein